MIEGKGLGDKKVNRVGPSLSNHYDKKLKLLARACDKNYTTMAGIILERCLDDADFVNELQNEFNLYTAYRVRVVTDYKTGRVHFVLYNDNERND